MVALLSWPGSICAQDRTFRLAAPQALIDSGLFNYILPRFSLKTRIKIELVADSDAGDLALNANGAGRYVFSGPSHEWYLAAPEGTPEGWSADFADWLVSDIGRRTIESFTVDEQQPFSVARVDEDSDDVLTFDGNATAGEKLAHAHCGRCHVVSSKNRMNAIGSTPSFAVLRSLPDWHERFQIFYARNPHPAFTQIEDVTEPFSDQRPPPIFPVLMKATDIDAILAFVSKIEPADLGAPLQHQ